MKEIAKQQEVPSLDVAVLLKAVVEKGADVATIERLLEVRRELKKEKAKELFYQALSEFQSNLQKIVKDQKVKNPDGTIRYSYASYDSIVKALQPLLKEYGFSYRFETEFENNFVVVSCIVTHEAGHSETTKFKAPVDASMRASEIQKWGAALTYAKRYSLSLAFGLATEEDTDTAEAEQQEPQPQQNGHSELASEQQKKAIFAILTKTGTAKENIHNVVSAYVGRKITSLNELTKKEASALIEQLQKEKEEMNEPF